MIGWGLIDRTYEVLGVYCTLYSTAIATGICTVPQWDHTRVRVE